MSAMNLIYSALFFALVFGLTSCQQCDVVVTSQAAIQEQIRDVLNEFIVDIAGSSAGNSSESRLNIDVEGPILSELHKLEEKVDFLQKEVNRFNPPDGMNTLHAADSCADVLSYNPESPSGYYWIKDVNGNAHNMYCDMTKMCGNITGGWMKVADMDLGRCDNYCPSGLYTNTGRYTNNVYKRTCLIPITPASCASGIFSTNDISYSKVCGKIKGYQVGSTEAFGHYGTYVPRGPHLGIEYNYVDGISITHGSPRNHIWTFASALDEDGGTFAAFKCPCSDLHRSHLATLPPPFVGNDYFCDTGSRTAASHGRGIYVGDPLWDGNGCGSGNLCCSFNRPPWFYKQLPHNTSDSIEMRICRDEPSTNENIAVESYEFYVQ